MDCHKVERALSQRQRWQPGSLPPDILEHVRTCERCRRLVDLLETPVVISEVPDALLAKLELQLTSGLQPVAQLPSTTYLFAAFLIAFLVLSVASGFGLGARSLAVMTLVQMAGVYVLLIASASVLALSLARRMAPGSRETFPSELLPAGLILALLLVISSLFQYHEEADFWKLGRPCITAGMALAVPSGILFWLLLRRGAVLSPEVSGANAGLLAGLVGMSVLEIHCPLTGALHIVTWHLGVALLSALCGLAIGAMVKRSTG